MSVLSARAITTLLNTSAVEIQGQLVVGKDEAARVLSELVMQKGHPSREAKRIVSNAFQQAGFLENKHHGLAIGF